MGTAHVNIHGRILVPENRVLLDKKSIITFIRGKVSHFFEMCRKFVNSFEELISTIYGVWESP